MGKKRKYKPPKLQSDDDFLQVFTQKKDLEYSRSGTTCPGQVNRHGLPVVDKAVCASDPVASESEDFPALLKAYLSRPENQPARPSPKPMPYHKRIKRYPPPEKDLDLHGYTVLAAEQKAGSFLTACKYQGYFTVRIIVGKGLHSELGPVLPDMIEDLLQKLKARDIVLGFAWERKKKSRSGAVIVYLHQFDD
ncbi:MAG: Smr/MutS family protein [Desulfobacteraceae bacterium]|nr:Smr/MutS family protein [Desulfobacteraceae bacterium]